MKRLVNLLVLILFSRGIKSLTENSSGCLVGESCVNFCCESETKCANGSFFDMKSLNASKNLRYDYKILKGYQKCDDMFEIDEVWAFSANGYVLVNTMANEENILKTYVHDKYCFFDDGSEQVMYFCFEEKSWLHFILSTHPYCKFYNV